MNRTLRVVGLTGVVVVLLWCAFQEFASWRLLMGISTRRSASPAGKGDVVFVAYSIWGDGLMYAGPPGASPGEMTCVGLTYVENSFVMTEAVWSTDGSVVACRSSVSGAGINVARSNIYTLAYDFDDRSSINTGNSSSWHSETDWISRDQRICALLEKHEGPGRVACGWHSDGFRHLSWIQWRRWHPLVKRDLLAALRQETGEQSPPGVSR